MVKYFMTHGEVVTRARKLVNQFNLDKNALIYPIPRGGVPVAYIVAGICGCGIVEKPHLSNIMIDDIIDSGKTRDAYKGFGVPFAGLINKHLYPEDEKLGWVVFPWEVTDKSSDTSAEDIPLRFIEYIGEDSERDGLKDSPQRVLKAWDFLYQGYKQNPIEILGRTFENDGQYDQMVMLRDIEFYSTCEHHFMPFFGKAHIAYLPSPSGRVVGISKLARLVDCFARRLQIQERMTKQIAEAIDEALKPLGIAVMIEASHLCMKARGVEKQNSVMITSALKGVLHGQDARMEFLLMRNG